MDKFVSSGSAQLWTTSSGDGVPLILFNGGPGCDDYLAPVAKLMDDRATVIRFEARGCGRSSWDGNYELETLIDDVEQIRRAYKIDQWVVAGHSAGPGYALAYAMKYPHQTLGVIGIAGGRFVNDRDWSEAYHQNLVSIGEFKGDLVFTSDKIVNAQTNQSWKKYIKQPRILRDLSQLKKPCVFINSEKDIRPNWPTQQLAALLPNARYVEIPDASHYAWFTHELDLKQELHKALAYIID